MEDMRNRTVVLHSGGPDICMVTKNAGIESSEVWGFTDTYPKQNELNGGLSDVTREASYLIIEESLYGDMTPDSETAQNTLRIMSHPHAVMLFSDEGIARVLPAAGMDKSDLERRVGVASMNGGSRVS